MCKNEYFKKRFIIKNKNEIYYILQFKFSINLLKIYKIISEYILILLT